MNFCVNYQQNILIKIFLKIDFIFYILKNIRKTNEHTNNVYPIVHYKISGIIKNQSNPLDKKDSGQLLRLNNFHFFRSSFNKMISILVLHSKLNFMIPDSLQSSQKIE